MRRTKRLIEELAQGAFLGLLLAAVLRLYLRQQMIPPESIPLLVLGVLCVSSPGLRAYAATFAFFVTGLALLGGPEVFGLCRATVFALFLFLWGDAVAPVVLLTVLWAIIVLAPLAFPSSFLPELTPTTVLGMGLEIVGSTLGWFLGALLVPRFQASPKLVTQRQYFVHLLLVPVLGLALMVCMFLLLRGGDSFAETLLEFHLLERPVILGVLGLLLAAMFLAVILANVLLDHCEQFLLAAAGAGVGRSVFPETDAALQMLDERAQTLQELERVISELRAGTSLNPAEVVTAWRGFQKASEVLAKVPDAVFSFTTNGRIVVATPTVSRMLKLSKSSLVGLDSSVLAQGASAWSKEIGEWVNWALSHQDQLMASRARRVWSSAQEGFYLEIVIRCWKQGGADVGRDLSSSRSSLCITFFLRRLPERRPLQLHLLQSTEFERLGAESAEFIYALDDGLREITEHVAVLTARFQNADGSSKAPTRQDAAELSQLTTELEKVLRRVVAELDKRRKRVEPRCESPQQFDFGDTLDAVLHHVCDLLGVERRIPVRVGSSEQGGEPERMLVTVDPEELWALMQYLVVLVHSILPRARDLRCELDFEQIGTSTASVITGSVPGRYVRLVFSHSGQSITPQVLAAQQEGGAVLQVGSGDMLTAGLFLLTRQLKRIGGFVSLQSSTTKGTSICLYVPTDQRHAKRPSRREMRRMTGAYTVGGSNQTQVLVVGENDREIAEIGEELDRLSFEMITRTPQELLGELVSQLDFEGRGFGAGLGENGAAEDRSENRPRLDVSPFRLVIFDGSKADFETLSLIDEIERENPKLAKILLHDTSNEERFRPLRHWVKLAKPVSRPVLQEKIRTALGKSSLVQESLVVIEGNDPVGGTGFGDED